MCGQLAGLSVWDWSYSDLESGRLVQVEQRTAALLTPFCVQLRLAVALSMHQLSFYKLENCFIYTLSDSGAVKLSPTPPFTHSVLE